MKIKFRDRMILLIGGLLTVAAGVFLVVTGLQFQGSIGEALRPGMRVACIVGGALMAAFGVYAVAFPFRRNGHRR